MRRRMAGRRGRALGSLAVLAGLLLALGTLGGYGLTFSAALRDCEEDQGIGRTRIVMDLGQPELERVGRARVVLSANEKGVMLGAGQWRWRDGWRMVNALAVEHSEGEKFWGGMVRLCDYAGESDLYYIFGGVEDPFAAEVEVRVYGSPGQAQPQARFVVGQEEWVRQDGRAYFLLAVELSGRPVEGLEGQLRLTSYDGVGKMLEDETASWDGKRSLWPERRWY